MPLNSQSEVQYTDISGDARSWSDVVPDQYFGPEHVLGKEIVLQIQQIVTEKFEDSLPRAVLRFTNDPKWLRLGKDNKQILKELFGDSPRDAIGKWITLTAGPNSMKNIVVKILPRITHQPGQQTTPVKSEVPTQTAVSQPTQSNLSAENEALKAQLAALQAKAG